MPNNALLDRIQRLEDIEAIRNLKSRYAAACDDGYDANRIAELFTEDAVWDGGSLGVAEGRESIRSFFEKASDAIPFAIHHVTNPAIEVDGDRATGSWYLWQPCVFADGDRAVWMAGPYRDSFRREAGEWRFERLEIRMRMVAPNIAGFGETRPLEETK